MHALGRLFNIHPVADDVYVNMKYASAVTFIGVNAAGDTWTLTQATSAGGGGAVVLATIDEFYVSATVGAVWAKVTQAAASTVVTTAAQDVVAISVEGTELGDGFSFLKLASTGAGLVYAITHDLVIQRNPANLPAIGA